MIKGGSYSELLFILNDFAANVIGISSGKRYAKEKGREAMRNGLLLSPLPWLISSFHYLNDISFVTSSFLLTSMNSSCAFFMFSV